MKLSTILVIETSGRESTVHVFPVSPEGHAEAVALFRQIASEQEGYFEADEIEEGVRAELLTDEDGSWYCRPWG